MQPQNINREIKIICDKHDVEMTRLESMYWYICPHGSALYEDEEFYRIILAASRNPYHGITEIRVTGCADKIVFIRKELTDGKRS